MCPSRIFARPASASPDETYPSRNEEAREFFQARLLLLVRVGFFFVLIHCSLANLSLLSTGRETLRSLAGRGANWTAPAMLLLLAALWIVARRWRLAWSTLRAADFSLLGAYSLSITANLWLSRSDPTLVSVALMPVAFATVFRAVLLPSSPARTAVVGLASFTPLFIAGAVIWGSPDLRWLPGQDLPSTSILVLRGVLWILLTVVISRILFGLRRQVHEARRLGQYLLEEKIGSGSMGEVYRARHALLRRPTAVKILSPELAGRAAIRRFEREVRLTSQLTHPNTIAVFDYGLTPDGTFYYAMELLDGLTLDRLVRDHGPQPPARVVHILRQVCASLREAHARGLIHRDVKPANAILCERGGIQDVVKVLDFGLVKDVEGRAGPTASTAGAITGTPLYMSPEAIRDPARIDARSDLYSVGAVGYWLLTGHHLFDEESFMEVCSKQLREPPVPPSERLGRPLPEDLEACILSALEKDPSRRPGNARALSERLAACRDAGVWGEAEAHAWWREHASAPRSPQPTAEPRQALPSPLAETMQVLPQAEREAR